MIKRIALFAAAVTVALSFQLIPALPVQAQSGNFGLDTAAKQVTGINKGAPEVIVGNIIARALQFVGVLFFLLMLYAGILWMTARGNEKNVERAKEMIIAAVIGLVIITAAYAITSAVIGSVSSASSSDSGGPVTSPSQTP